MVPEGGKRKNNHKDFLSSDFFSIPITQHILLVSISWLTRVIPQSGEMVGCNAHLSMQGGGHN